MGTQIRLMPIEAPLISLNEFNKDIWINVIREPYTEIAAYFIRSYKGVLLVVNSNLTTQQQAQAVKIIEKALIKCPVSNMGLIDKDWNYKCNGICCK